MSKKKTDLQEPEMLKQEDAVVETAENAENAAPENTENKTVSVFKASMDDDDNRKGVYIDKAESEAFLEAQRKKKKRKKIIVTVVTVAIVLLLAFIIYKIIFGGNKGAIKWPSDYIETGCEKKAGEKIDNNLGDTLIATKTNKDGKTTELWFSPADSLLRIVVKKGDKVDEYRSWPAPTEELAAESKEGETCTKYAKNHDIISSLVRVGYSEAQMDGGKDFGINQVVGVQTEYFKIEDGFKVKYTLPASVSKTNMDFETIKFDFTLSFSVDFYLDENGDFISAVPVNEIIEPNWEDYKKDDFKYDEMPRISSVTPLPYLLSARQGDAGQYITPDGSGGVTNFASTRISQYDEYVKRIYGYDDTFDTFNYPNMTNEKVSLPVYGYIQNDSMVTVFAEEGETDSLIIIGQPGMRSLDVYYIYFTHRFREYYISSVGTTGAYTFCEIGVSSGDFVERYVFDIKDDGEYTYVDTAKKTRDFIIDKWNGDKAKLDYLKDANVNTTKKTDATNDLINLKIFFADENKARTNIFSKFKVMTTFAQAKDIISDAAGEGRTKIHYSLLGWQQDGYFGNIMKKYGIESVLGGKKGLKDLTSYAKENNLDIAADVNLLIYYSNPTGGASLRSSVVKDPATNYSKYKLISNAGVFQRRDNCYHMSPLYYDSHLLQKDIKNLSKLGFTKVDLQQLGDLLYTDYNKENALLRLQALEYYRNWIVEYKKVFNEVSVFYGYEYAASVADNILGIPTGASQVFIIDESIPFLEIVYHGLIDYYSESINRSSDNVQSLLKSIEYGAFFTYEVTNDPTDTLKYTNYNSLFKAQYISLESDIKNAYVIADKVLTPVANAFIENHCKVANDVYCTEYDNNIKIYVNYGKTEYETSEGNVPARGVLLVENGVATPVNVG